MGRRTTLSQTLVWQSVIWLVTVVILVGLFFKAPAFLVSEDALEETEPIALVLMGDIEERLVRAVELYRQHKIEKIMFVQTQLLKSDLNAACSDDAARSYQFLLKSHVPEGDILFLRDAAATSTADEAVAVRDYIQSHPATSLVVITSWYHTRRAKWTFNNILQGISKVKTVPAYPLEKDWRQWWHHEDLFLLVFTELLKWVYHLVFGL